MAVDTQSTRRQISVPFPIVGLRNSPASRTLHVENNGEPRVARDLSREVNGVHAVIWSSFVSTTRSPRTSNRLSP